MSILILDRYKDIYLLKYSDDFYCIDKLNKSVGITLKACDTEKKALKEFKKIKNESERGKKWKHGIY